MFNYERYTKEQIDTSLTVGFKELLIQITPRALTHAVAAGCFVQWRYDKENKAYFMRNLCRVLVIESDNSDVVIVYEERPENLGGPRVVAMEYKGPK